MRTARYFLVFAAAACGALLSSERPAVAFCRTTTSPPPADFRPTESSCWTQGVPLWWRNACVGYSVQKDASKQVPYADAAKAMATAFSQWSGAMCNGAARPSVEARDEGAVSCATVQYNTDAPNQHLIVFRDESWPHDDVANSLALTTVTFDADTGEIYDADMEINTAEQTMTLGDPVPRDGFDFQSVVTHESGHFLGLAHSGDSNATMYAAYTPGSTAMRALTPDDMSGICAIYPADGTRAVATSVAASGKLAMEACDPTPRHGFSTECRKACTANGDCAAGQSCSDRGACVASVDAGAPAATNGTHATRDAGAIDATIDAPRTPAPAATDVAARAGDDDNADTPPDAPPKPATRGGGASGGCSASDAVGGGGAWSMLALVAIAGALRASRRRAGACRRDRPR